MEATYPSFANITYDNIEQNYTKLPQSNIISDLPRIYEQVILPMLTYVPPILVVAGIIGNLLTLVVLRQPPLKQCSIGFYLRVFAVIDILVLIMKAAVEWTINYFQLTHIPNISDPLCRLWQFGWNVVNSSATWLPVCMMIDRYIILWHPRKSSERCNVFMAKVAIAMVFTGLVVINIHAMWSAYLNLGQCNQINPVNSKLHELVWFWTAMSANYYIPLMLLLVLDVAIIVGIIFKGDRGHYFGQSASEEGEMTSVSAGVCVTFFLVASPEYICYLLEENLNLDRQGREMMILFIALTAAQLLTLLNYVLVFAFCILLSPSFRTTLCSLFVNVFKRKLSQSEYELATANNNMESTALEIDNPIILTSDTTGGSSVN